MLKKGLALVALGLLAAGLCAWGGVNEPEVEAVAVKLAGEVARGGYGIVTTTELSKWIAAKKPMLIVDTMPFESSFKKGHIPGAVCFELPVEEMKDMDQATRERFVKVLGPDKARTLVFYCGFTKCGRSHNGAVWAKKLGYTDVYRCPGGIKAWKEAGLTVEK